MTHPPHAPDPPLPPPGPRDAGLDPANQSLADALRRSFAVLKAIMAIMVVAYALSGWFRVEPGEVGFVVRLGRVVGDRADRVLTPGWHWAFPYPLDEVVTVGVQKERTLPLSFMFALSDDEKIRKEIRRVSYATLSPLRDHYLLTGDVNILHAELRVRYRVSDPVAYVSFVHDSSPRDDSPPEHEILSALLRRAAIRVAAGRRLIDVYGAGHGDFLRQVTEEGRRTLRALDQAGCPLGIELVAVIAAQFAGREAILPPRATQDEFDQVQAAVQQQSAAISGAEGKRQELLNLTAGPAYEELAEAIDAEFVALLDALRAANDPQADPARTREAERTLAEHKAATDGLLEASSGEVQRTINAARAAADRTVGTVIADRDRFLSLLPRYEQEGRMLLSRLQTEVVQQVLADPMIGKMLVPGTRDKIWVEIPRDPNAPAARPPEQKPGQERAPRGFIDRNPFQMKTPARRE
jgi:membrane protease subunit HflK